MRALLSRIGGAYGKIKKNTKRYKRTLLGVFSNNDMETIAT